jgi:hypothetical protein
MKLYEEWKRRKKRRKNRQKKKRKGIILCSLLVILSATNILCLSFFSPVNLLIAIFIMGSWQNEQKKKRREEKISIIEKHTCVKHEHIERKYATNGDGFVKKKVCVFVPSCDNQIRLWWIGPSILTLVQPMIKMVIHLTKRIKRWQIGMTLKLYNNYRRIYRWRFLVLLVLVVVTFYFLIWRPVLVDFTLIGIWKARNFAYQIHYWGAHFF